MGGPNNLEFGTLEGRFEEYIYNGMASQEEAFSVAYDGGVGDLFELKQHLNLIKIHPSKN